MARAGAMVSESRAELGAGLTTSVAVRVTVPALAVMVTVLAAVTALVVAVKVFAEVPALTVTEDGTVAADGSLLVRVTAVAAAAGAVGVMVPVGSASPPSTVVGDRTTWSRVTAGTQALSALLAPTRWDFCVPSG